MDEKALRRAVQIEYLERDLANFRECMTHLERGCGPKTDSGEPKFILELQRDRVTAATSDAVRTARMVEWRELEFCELESEDCESYRERSRKCAWEKERLETSASPHHREMARLCGDEARDCAVRADLSAELVVRADRRRRQYREIQIEHEVRDQMFRYRVATDQQQNHHDAGGRKILNRLDDDLQKQFDALLVEEGKDAALFKATDEALGQRALLRDDRKAEVCRRYRSDRESEGQPKAQ